MRAQRAKTFAILRPKSPNFDKLLVCCGMWERETEEGVWALHGTLHSPGLGVFLGGWGLVAWRSFLMSCFLNGAP